MNYLNAPECDALIFRLPNDEELEISYVVLDGEDVYHERNATRLKIAMLEALKEIAKQTPSAPDTKKPLVLTSRL